MAGKLKTSIYLTLIVGYVLVLIVAASSALTEKNDLAGLPLFVLGLPLSAVWGLLGLTDTAFVTAALIGGLAQAALLLALARRATRAGRIQ